MKATLSLLIGAIFGCLVIQEAYACDEESITTISSSGLIIQTDGGTYTVGGGDQSTASSWSVGDDVLVCDDKMVNKGDGEEIEVSRR